MAKREFNRTTIRFEPETFRLLKVAAAIYDEPMEKIVDKAVTDYLKKLSLPKLPPVKS